MGLAFFFLVFFSGVTAVVASSALDNAGDEKQIQPRYHPIKVQPAGSPTVFSDSPPQAGPRYQGVPVAPRRPISANPTMSGSGAKDSPQKSKL